MIDTIRAEIHNLSPVDIEQIKRCLVTNLSINNKDGSVMYEFTTGALRGSWDYKIRIFIKDKIHQSIVSNEGGFNSWGQDFKSVKKKTILVDCPEFVVLEFSPTKWAEGHNLLNCDLPQDLMRLVGFRQWLCVQLGVNLPSIKKWFLTRVDLGMNYKMRSKEEVLNFIELFSGLKYPRRKPPRIWETMVKWYGITNVKFYAKGPELRAHDRKRLQNFNEPDVLAYLQEKADNILRFEVEFRTKKLKNLSIITIDDFFRAKINWENELMDEYQKLTDGATSSVVYDYKSALKHIKDHSYTGCGVSVEAAVAIWVSVSTQGITYANKAHGRKKVYRARKFFKIIGLNCISNLREIEVEFDSKKVNILDWDSDDEELGKEFGKVLFFPVPQFKDYHRQFVAA